MARITSRSIGDVADSIIASVERADQIKVAEVQAVRDATPKLTSGLGDLMQKLAADLRSAGEDVTYQDLADAMGARV